MTWVACAILTLLPACGGSYQAWAETPSSRSSGGGGPGGISVASTGGYAGESDEGDGEYALAADRYAQAAPAAQPAQSSSGAQPPPPPTADDAHRGPLLVYTASLALAVHQVSEKQGMIEAMATEAGGHLSERTGNQIRIRVPAASFERVLAQILELGDVLSRDVSVQDVTEQFHDISLRIRTLEAMYARVRQLLEEAENVEQALAVEQHLQRITMELESLRGRLRFLSDRIAFSTITVRFQERTTVSEPTFDLPFQWLRSLGLQNLMRLR